MIIEVLTLFPEMFPPVLDSSIVGRARQSGLLDIRVRNIRDHATDRHHVADDTPYGGGPGMVMKCEPLAGAFDAVADDHPDCPLRRVYLSPQGRPWTQALAEEYSRLPGFVLLCGHYEDIDERIRELYVDDEISMGDFVLTGGEIPAMAVIDSVVRLVGGVLGNAESIEAESFGTEGLLDHPHYTRPTEFRGLRVPAILMGGHHERITRWRRLMAIERTLARRPDLVRRKADKLTAADRAFLEDLLRDDPRELTQPDATPKSEP